MLTPYSYQNTLFFCDFGPLNKLKVITFSLQSFTKILLQRGYSIYTLHNIFSLVIKYITTLSFNLCPNYYKTEKTHWCMVTRFIINFRNLVFDSALQDNPSIACMIKSTLLWKLFCSLEKHCTDCYDLYSYSHFNYAICESELRP